jgi:hypothetical protein
MQKKKIVHTNTKLYLPHYSKNRKQKKKQQSEHFSTKKKQVAYTINHIISKNKKNKIPF